MEIVPKKGFAGLIENWQSDVIAAFSVALVALPLGLGIALASGVPPMAGILSAIVGGIVTTFFRGSYVAINGPTAGLIAVVLASLSSLDDGTGQALNYVLAAFIVAGAVQVLLGLLRLGRYADIFHSSVIRGILAAIGIIIFATQIHIALGTNAPQGSTVIESLGDIFSHIPHINPFVAIISLVGFLLLIFQSRISYKLFHMIPAPIWILVVSIPFVFAFNFFEDHDMMLFGNSYNVGPHLLIEIPDNLLDAITHPNFSKIDTLAFWLSVVSIAILASIESLAAGKAIDKLDQYKRRTDLNKDLIGIGLSTMVSGALGGLPVITVIVRSTVNVHNHAKTKWSNFYHGILLILIVFLLKPVIQMIPLCSLSIILVYAGFKLASPKVLRQVYDQGLEQLIFFLGTLIITLYTDLLRGIFGGLFLTLTIHVLLARLPVHTFFRLTFNSGTNLFFKKDGTYLLKIKGIANFLSAIFIDKFLLQIPAESKVVFDFSEARLVGFSILEDLYEFQRNHENGGGSLKMVGLEKHISSTDHKLAIKLQVSSPNRLTNRQLGLKDLAAEYGWKYNSEVDHNADNLQTFYFFKSRPIEFKENCISGMDEGMFWELADVTFEEGAFMAIEEYNTTLGLIDLPYKMPKFVIEKKGKLGKYLEFTSHKDIDYVIYEDFPENFRVKVEDKEEMKAFMSEELKGLIENSGIRHIESNGDAILIFNDSLRFAQLKDYSKMLFFTEELRKLIKKSKNGKKHSEKNRRVEHLNP